MVEIVFLDREGKYQLVKDSDGYTYPKFSRNISGKNKNELILNLIKALEFAISESDVE